MASKVSVGKTAPVPLGQQPSANSLPVVFAEDQQPIPVEEQNKIQSEVALSLLGIPRAEVALGIFADVNTYDINPTEWAQFPIENTADVNGSVSYGVEHVPDEAGARLVASPGKTTLLTSKRFFRYQPGRVSASTMGVKMNVTKDPKDDSTLTTAQANAMKGAPTIKKWGIFDKFDGYYFETANGGKGNDFRCVRRTQAIVTDEPSGYSGDLSWLKNGGDTTYNTSTNFGEAGKDPVIIRDGLVYVAAAIYDPSLCYSPADTAYIDNAGTGNNNYNGNYSGAGERLKDKSFDSNYAVRLATYDGSTWDEKMNERKFMFPFDQSTTVALEPEDSSISRGYIRADAHCNFYQVISNLNRKGGYSTELQNYNDFYNGSENQTNWGTSAGLPSSYSGIDTWDPSPTQSVEGDRKKIWHLMVNVQGAPTTKLVTADLNKKDVPNRTVDANGNVTLKEWFNTCVPRPYRMVYEWRPVRAMFSGDKLDGAESVVRWSDINTAANDTTAGGSAINRPGDPVLTADGEELKTQSAYNIDFNKVTMWKTEFSWYGAVGAVFLCYVPVASGEARWVRVHHIRASNQHSVASLGNATLPITYLTHQGKEADLPESRSTLVKYGASYYIDGGDKGTVRLLSKASDFSRNVSPGFITFPGADNKATGGWVRNGTSIAEIDVAAYTGSGTRKGTISYDTAVGLIGAFIEDDKTNKVKWVGLGSGTDVKLYFESSLPADTNDLKLIIPRAQKSLLSFRAKDFILNRKGDEVRNRLQIYPIKLGAGITGGGATVGGTTDLMTIRTIKNPLKIVTNTDFSGNVTGSELLYGFNGAASQVENPLESTENYVNTKTSTLPVEVAFNGGNNPTDMLPAVGRYRYGYFMGSKDLSQASGFNPATDSDYLTGTMFPVLGKLERKSTGYTFSKLFSYPEPIYITGYFLPEKMLSMGQYDAAGYGIFANEAVTDGGHLGSSDQSKWDKLQTDSIVTWEEITRLSGARVGQDMKLTPVANTGNEILAYYGGPGGYQFDLQDYFAYNKEYLSFPLTDEVDILNIYGHYDISQNPTPAPFFVNTALTWEEQ